MSENPYGYVYRIRNKLNGKTYIGQRKVSRDKAWRSYMGSGSLIKQAVTKYGKENFVKEFLGYAWSRSELDEIEYELIQKEWEKGLGQYNQVRFTPNPEAWTLKTVEEKAIIREKRSRSLKEAAAKNKGVNASHIAAEKRYSEFVAQHGNNALEAYEKLKSAAKVANELKVSLRLVYKFLQRNDIKLNYRTVSGVNHPPEVKAKISARHKEIRVRQPRKRFECTCESCGIIFLARAKDSKLCKAGCIKELILSKMDVKEVIELYESGYSSREIARHFGHNYYKDVLKTLKKNNVKIRA